MTPLLLPPLSSLDLSRDKIFGKTLAYRVWGASCGTTVLSCIENVPAQVPMSHVLTVCPVRSLERSMYLPQRDEHADIEPKFQSPSTIKLALAFSKSNPPNNPTPPQVNRNSCCTQLYHGLLQAHRHSPGCTCGSLCSLSR